MEVNIFAVVAVVCIFVILSMRLAYLEKKIGKLEKNNSTLLNLSQHIQQISSAQNEIKKKLAFTSHSINNYLAPCRYRQYDSISDSVYCNVNPNKRERATCYDGRPCPSFSPSKLL